MQNYYKRYRNKLTSILHQSEKDYYKHQLESNKNKLTKTWKTLRMIINKKKTTHQNTTFEVNGNKISNNSTIANLFNKYFVNAPRELCKTIPAQCKDPCSYVKSSINESLYLNPATEGEICKILLGLKNSSPGHDDINISIFKGVAEHISKPLTHLCNLSILSGRVPDSRKIAKVIPIHKKGKINEFCNYRPVSVLPALSKVYERLLYNRILEFVGKHEILSDHQFGFRKKYSTSHAINSLVNQFHDSVEKNEFMIGLFVDLSRAFDTISHKILIDKLYKYGIRGIALEWIKDYLLNRKQYVVYNNTKSNISSVEIGVPQGSILGPLLFIIYVNELPTISSALSCIQFADDTSIFIRGRSLPKITSILNQEMDKITDWLNLNMLTINVSKTNYMIMTTQGKRIDDQECTITVNGSIAKRVSQTMFLGIVLDDKLTWNNHINHIYAKISKVIGIL